MAEHISQSVSSTELRQQSEDDVRRLAAELEQGADFDPFAYTPPGPVAQAFLSAPEPTAVIMGPLGGGKTTSALALARSAFSPL